MEKRICKICGKEFTSKSSRRSICYDNHYHKCPVCGKDVLTKDLQHLNSCCSMKCTIELRKQTTSSRYEVHPSQSAEANKKRADTNLKRYGVANVFNNASIQNKAQSKMKRAMNEATHLEEPIQKVCTNCHKPFYTHNKFQKICQNCKTGVCKICGKTFERQWPYTQTLCSEECKIKQMRIAAMEPKTCELCGKVFTPMSPRQKYCSDLHIRTCQVCGREFAISFNCNDTKTCNSAYCKNEMRKRTCRERYGVDDPMQLPSFRSKMSATMLEKYGVAWFGLTEEYKKNHSGFMISKINRTFSDKLSALSIENTLEKSIERYSYDIEISSRKILIEIDPTYTHNSYGNHWNTDGLSEDYHRIKSATAEKHGYRCIHVFDWDDEDKIIKLITPKQILYARNCEIKSVSREDCNTFLDKHHLQGKCRGQEVRLGLYYKDMLVEIMTFGKPRYNKNFEWELLRLCSYSEYTIVGGASKLFKHFRKNYEGSIISYCDASKFSGEVYEKLGMTLYNRTRPAKIWSRKHDKITDNLLRQRGFDQLFGTNFGKGTSNEQLMLNDGWLPVYDCGQKVYTIQ